MSNREDFFKELRKFFFNDRKIDELTYLVQLIDDLLKELTLEEIKIVQDWIDETIEMYYQEELDNAIEKAKLETEYIEDEDGNYEEFNKYFDRVWYDRYEPNIDLIIQDFNVETRYIEGDKDLLEWLLKTGYRDDGLPDGIKDYHIMAVMALEYIDRFINGDSLFGDGNKFDQQNLFRAFWSFISSEQMKAKYEIEQLISKSKRENAQKAAKARHKENHKIKDMVVSRWIKYLEQSKEKGIKISKTAFADKIFKELEKAHQKDPQKNKRYSVKTIRNNWLQGI
ncbi:hypothetical protein BKG94_07255 [Rodentibacter ratti]|uniref:hypothetical protein n=1 Tax=Rodentibacter ratti TaxID=1906745 RepID=UPI000985CD01|nr:hypothetical protein [Rodentibacter ratti]OOF88321.1 hypothetical protein BKG94_07255 [Rodentibacter ratti]